MKNNSVASTAPVYTLSVTADLSGIPVHSIRQYINKWLMIPFKKESSRNLFSQVDILRLKYIYRLLEKASWHTKIAFDENYDLGKRINLEN